MGVFVQSFVPSKGISNKTGCSEIGHPRLVALLSHSHRSLADEVDELLALGTVNAVEYKGTGRERVVGKSCRTEGSIVRQSLPEKSKWHTWLRHLCVDAGGWSKSGERAARTRN